MPATKIIILLSQSETDQHVAEIMRQEFQARGISDVCILTEESAAANRSAEQRAAELLAAVTEQLVNGAAAPEEDVYTEEEAEKIKKRLEDLGYL